MSTPATRPLTAKGLATRTRILDAASELMYARGVAATSIDDVKLAAGVSSSQLYHYFADRRALVGAVIERQTEIVLGVQEPHLLRVEDLETLWAWRDAMIAITQARGGAGGCPLGSLSAELSDGDEMHRTALAAGFGRWQDAIRAGLERMRDRGQLAPEADPERSSVALLAALQGGLILSQAHRSARPLEIALDGVLERVAAGARAPEADRRVS